MLTFVNFQLDQITEAHYDFMQNCHSMLCNWETPYENQAKISIQNFLFFYSTKILKLKLI